MGLSRKEDFRNCFKNDRNNNNVENNDGERNWNKDGKKRKGNIKEEEKWIK